MNLLSFMALPFLLFGASGKVQSTVPVPTYTGNQIDYVTLSISFDADTVAEEDRIYVGFETSWGNPFSVPVGKPYHFKIEALDGVSALTVNSFSYSIAGEVVGGEQQWDPISSKPTEVGKYLYTANFSEGGWCLIPFNITNTISNADVQFYFKNGEKELLISENKNTLVEGTDDANNYEVVVKGIDETKFNITSKVYKNNITEAEQDTPFRVAGTYSYNLIVKDIVTGSEFNLWEWWYIAEAPTGEEITVHISHSYEDVIKFTYNGEKQVPSFTVTDGTNTYVLGTDYTVHFESNEKPIDYDPIEPAGYSAVVTLKTENLVWGTNKHYVPFEIVC